MKRNLLQQIERVKGYLDQKNAILQRMAKGLDSGDLADVKALIEELELLVRIQVLKTGQKFVSSI